MSNGFKSDKQRKGFFGNRGGTNSNVSFSGSTSSQSSDQDRVRKLEVVDVPAKEEKKKGFISGLIEKRKADAERVKKERRERQAKKDAKLREELKKTTSAELQELKRERSQLEKQREADKIAEEREAIKREIKASKSRRFRRS